ncbi:MAG: hypothetical protein HY761_03690 [Candidatus Omnitrophica bacterium]|nr:hypothetical protein [Candidatus Omnitrophota bacterium]
MVFLNMRIKQIICCVFVSCFLVSALGCEAFVRKFTRKKKTQVEEEMVLEPEEFKGPGLSKEQLYRQYFLFWKSWQTELIEAFLQARSQKKKLDCAQQAIDNLNNLRPLLNTDAQTKLDVYIGQLKNLKHEIEGDAYNTHNIGNRQIAERIKMNVLRDFSWQKIKDSVI